jgi:hypothetical protein
VKVYVKKWETWGKRPKNFTNSEENERLNTMIMSMEGYVVLWCCGHVVVSWNCCGIVVELLWNYCGGVEI